MFRKATLVAAICAAISFGASASTPVWAADLGGSYTDYRGVCGHRLYNGVPVSFGYGLCYQRVLLQTPWGPRWRLVNQCC